MSVRSSQVASIHRCRSLIIAAGSANATEAVNISLTAPAAGATKSIASFNPKFTYSIFGDEETIFGYKDLKINLRYLTYDMRPHVKVSWGKKFNSVGETEAADIDDILRQHLPGGECRLRRNRTIANLPKSRSSQPRNSRAARKVSLTTSPLPVRFTRASKAMMEHTKCGRVAWRTPPCARS